MKTLVAMALASISAAALSACNSGVSQDQYDQTAAELTDVRGQLDDAEVQLRAMQTELADLRQRVEAAQASPDSGDSEQYVASDYLKVALDFIDLGGADSTPSREELDALFEMVAGLGSNDETYRRLSDRLMQATDQRAGEALVTEWLIYTMRAAYEALQ